MSLFPCLPLLTRLPTPGLSASQKEEPQKDQDRDRHPDVPKRSTGQHLVSPLGIRQRTFVSMVRTLLAEGLFIIFQHVSMILRRGGRVMFDGAFFFTGCIGRLAFFVNSLVAVPAALIAMFFLALLPMAWPGKIALMSLVGIAFAWSLLSLHVRRIRDIGWDPFVVIIGAFAVACGDVILAHAVPALSRDGYSTPIGSLFSLGLSLALMFWPGRDSGIGHDRRYGYS